MQSRLVPQHSMSRVGRRTIGVGLLAMGVACAAWGLSRSTAPTHAALARIEGAAQRQAFGRLPLSFTKNQGQTDARVDYLAHGPGYVLFLDGEGALLKFTAASPPAQAEKIAGKSARIGTGRFLGAPVAAEATAETAQDATLKMSLTGARTQAQAIAEEPQAGRSNYFVGNDPSKWVTNASSYARVRYEGVYPGVDLVYYGSQRELEYDFVVAAHADALSIRLAFEGARGARIDDAGNLVLDLGGHEVIQHKPIAYQQHGGQKTSVDARYLLASAGPGAPIEVAFDIAEHDADRALVIDPVLAYSTYVSGSGGEQINGLALDSDGNLYATGTTTSTDFPVVGGLPGDQGGTPAPGPGDAFVIKLNPEGTALIYSTYLAGNDWDDGISLKVDAQGAVYLTGFTASTNFPVVGGLPSDQAGTPDGLHSPFVTKLNPAGDALEYSTYLGAGSGNDEAYAIGIDADGSAYVTGYTSPPYAFPIVGGLDGDQGGLPSGDGSIFISKLDPAGDALVYSTYLSGSDFEWATTIAVNGAGEVYIGGLTYSLNMPRVGGLTPEDGGVANAFGSAYYAKLNADGDQLVYSTYLAGSDASSTYGDVLTIDAAGNLYIAGRTSSAELPVVGGLSPEQGGGGRHDDCCADIYIAKLNPEANAIIYGTYFGGNWIDGAYGIAVDGAGNLYLAGQTNSTNFPQVSGLPSDQGGDAPIDTGGGFGPHVCSFATELNPTGDALVFSTYFCGNNTTAAMALTPAGEVYIAGNTGSVGLDPFPIVGGLPADQGGTPRGGLEAFIAKLSPNAPLVSFASARYAVSESGGSIDVVVTRNSSDAATVDYATADESATAGVDYVATSGSLSWNAGDMSPRTITIPIIDDDMVEGDEMFTVNLSNGIGATIGTPAIATVLITEDPLPDSIFVDGFDGASP